MNKIKSWILEVLPEIPEELLYKEVKR